MKDTVFLVADVFGVVRMTKRQPTLKRDEAAVRLSITIPDGCFKSPIISVGLDVPEDRVVQPSADVAALPTKDGEA